MTGNKRRLALWGVGLAGLLTFLFYMARDLNLQRQEPPKGLKALPDVEAEDLSLVRTVNGEEWRITAKGAAKACSTVKARGLWVQKGPEGAPTGKLQAAEGFYDEDLSSMELKSFRGLWTVGGRPYQFSGDRGIYSFQKDIWSFSGGVEIRQDRMSARSDSGKVEGGRKVLLEGNVEVLMEVR
ncbi:MAG: hypothetical protein N2315_06350 [Thermanaerothrix sp.]|nr:hypothetical protein [Thermanaerothrix sp.]